jgi:hypothetical protein
LKIERENDEKSNSVFAGKLRGTGVLRIIPFQHHSDIYEETPKQYQPPRYSARKLNLCLSLREPISSGMLKA